MNVRQLALARQKNQYVGRVDNPVTVLSSMLAIQAQDYLGGLWAIGARTRCSEREVEQLLNDRKIVRSWPMRGTLHFVAAEDLRWLQQLLAPRVLAAGASRQRELGLDGRVLVKSESALIRVLEGGCALTREEMTAALERAKVSTEGQRGYHILVRLAMQGLLCFGPRKGKSQTFVLLDEWIPKGKSLQLDREDSLTMLARRYFAGHGPATERDLAWWSGLSPRDVRKAIALAHADLEEIVIHDVSYWRGKASQGVSDARAKRDAMGASADSDVHLLPPFDEILLGYKDRAATLDPSDAGKVNPGKNGMFLPIVISSGRVIGTWKRVLKKSSVELTVTPWGPTTKRTKASIESAARAYALYVGLEAKVTIAS
ncbi:MAG: AlkZ family DNA glycosylase [Polyangiaceae bacterium]|nr:AlkZ family DNA glycosylase [Polyangiaceae bacterium]